MNRRAFLGRALTVVAGAAAAVVAAPAMVTKVAHAEAAPAVLPSEPPEPTLVFPGGGEVVLDRFVTETREATSDVTLSEVWNGDQVTYSVEGETGPIYGVTFPNVNASPPSMPSGWQIARAAHTHGGSAHTHGTVWGDGPIAHSHGAPWGGDVTTGGLPSGEHAVW
jgi:hypothetical protein